MFRKSNFAAALAAAALGVAALASPASALPIDNVTLDNGNHKFSFGNGCAAGAGPAMPGTVDWDNNANNTSAAPEILGTLCLQNTTADARLHVIYHTSTGDQITHFRTLTSTGNGGSLNQFAVNDKGSRVSYQSLAHLHVDLEKNNGSGWTVEDTVTLFP